MPNETDVQAAIDALMRGASLEILARHYTLTPEEWENVIVAQELTSIQVAPRSQIRDELKEYLMVTAEQERLLGEHYREEPTEQAPKRRNGPRWLLIILVMFAIIGGVVLLAAVGIGLLGLFTVNVSPSYETIPQPVESYSNDRFIEPFGENTANVYLVQQTPDATFGGIFTLQNMIVTQERYSSETGVILIWQMTQALNNAQYSVIVERRNAEFDYPEGTHTADIGFPLDAGATIATEHNIFGGIEEQNVIYTVEIIDRTTDENLLLANGEEKLTLRLQPAVTIPGQLVPEGGEAAPTAIAPTATPIEP